MNDEDRKFCRDCKHHRGDQARFFKCGLTGIRYDFDYLVTGIHATPEESLQYMDYCSTARLPGGNCGPDGKLFEPVEVTTNG
jgi:hypothetical protein